MSLSINDGKVAPVAHVFGVDQIQNGIDASVFVNRANANGPNFWERLLILAKLAPANRPKQYHTVKTDLNLPIQGTVDGSPAVIGQIRVVMTILADQNVATEANLKDAIALQKNALSNATLIGQMATFAPANV